MRDYRIRDMKNTAYGTGILVIEQAGGGVAVVKRTGGVLYNGTNINKAIEILTDEVAKREEQKLKGEEVKND